VPTGIAIRDPRQQLFSAAERVLLRDGPSSLTSRAVTNEAGFAKGVLHRHFCDFDDFLAALITDRIEQIGKQTEDLLARGGSGSVVANVTGALSNLFGSVASAMVGLLIFRDDLRKRIRDQVPAGIPVLTEGREMIAAYLNRERDLGRVAAGADLEALSEILIATTAMDFADRPGDRTEMLVSTVLGPSLVGPR
jgi:AcrR family transcriptional regulator